MAKNILELMFGLISLKRENSENFPQTFDV